MDIYIAASWQQAAAVDLLAARLRDQGHEVFAFTEQAELGLAPKSDWYESPAGYRVWCADMQACVGADLVLYLGGGCDAWAEVGAAWSVGVPVLGLRTKGEAVGIQRRMVMRWCDTVAELLAGVADVARDLAAGVRPGNTHA